LLAVMQSPSISASKSVVIIKNLPVEITERDVQHFLEDFGLAADSIEFHFDGSSSFKGTVFVKYSDPTVAQAVVAKFGPSSFIHGRKVRVELQRSKATKAGKEKVENIVTTEQKKQVQEFLEDFRNSSDQETFLPLSLGQNPFIRKYVHSHAESIGLSHATTEIPTGPHMGHKSVLLTKSRLSKKSETFNVTKSFKKAPYNGSGGILPKPPVNVNLTPVAAFDNYADTIRFKSSPLVSSVVLRLLHPFRV